MMDIADETKLEAIKALSKGVTFSIIGSPSQVVDLIK